MKCKLKQALSLLLALCLVLSLCACGKGDEKAQGAGGGNAAPTQTPEFTYAAEYTALTPDGEHPSPDLLTDDGVYFDYMEKVADGVVPEGATPEYEGQYDVYEPRLTFCDLSGKAAPLSAYAPVPSEVGGEGKRDFRVSQSIRCLLMNSEGNLVVLENVYASWSEAPDTVKVSDPDYYNYLASDSAYYLRVLDTTGAELSCARLDIDNPDSLMPYQSRLDEKDNLIVATQDSGALAFRPDGAVAYKLEFSGWIYSIAKARDGRVGILFYDNSNGGFAFRLVDSAAGAFESQSYTMPYDAYDMLDGGGDYDLYYTSGTQFYGYDLATEEATVLFSWIGCDINSNMLGELSVADDGAVHAILRSDGDEEDWRYEYVTVSKVPYDSVPHKESLSLATLYLDYNTQNAIIDFNRANDKYRIDVVDYSQYNTAEDYSAAVTKLLTEIMSGVMPDILCLSSDLPYRQLAAKGLLEDLYPYFDSDGELNRDDFFPNVLAALEVDGKLYSACAGFMVMTAIGASSVVGDTPGWTYDDYTAALATMPEGCEGFPFGIDRDTMLEVCLALDMNDYVDWSAGTCNFDSEDFIKLLEFAAAFPDASLYENYEYTAEDGDTARIAEGKQMLLVESFTSTDFFMYDYDKLFGGSATCIGFPTNHGVGNVLTTAENYAISSTCRNKDAAWDFVRGFLTEDYQEDTYYLPTNQNAFETNLERGMEITYQQDANGNYILDENGERIPQSRGMVSTGAETFEIYATTPRQAEMLRTAISSAEKMMDYDTSIIDIVKEQAAAYFAGQKSAAETAKLIQSKANIYINEQK